MRRRYRLAAIAAVLGAAVVAARVGNSNGGPVHYVSVTCGIERWGPRRCRIGSTPGREADDDRVPRRARPAPVLAASYAGSRVSRAAYLPALTAAVTLVSTWRRRRRPPPRARLERQGPMIAESPDAGGVCREQRRSIASVSDGAGSARSRVVRESERDRAWRSSTSSTGRQGSRRTRSSPPPCPRASGVSLTLSSPPTTTGRLLRLPTTTAPPPTTTAPPPANCAASYPDVCIPPPPPDLNCADIPYRRFR